uniref:Uncharacterized protein n=1 Tax=Anguilla anguilla TaxID=7936 RepID=A0A0E9PAL5_ANGAN
MDLDPVSTLRIERTGCKKNVRVMTNVSGYSLSTIKKLRLKVKPFRFRPSA